MSLKYIRVCRNFHLYLTINWCDKHNIISSIQFKSNFKIKFKNSILIVILLLY